MKAYYIHLLLSLFLLYFPITVDAQKSIYPEIQWSDAKVIAHYKILSDADLQKCINHYATKYEEAHKISRTTSNDKLKTNLNKVVGSQVYQKYKRLYDLALSEKQNRSQDNSITNTTYESYSSGNTNSKYDEMVREARFNEEQKKYDAKNAEFKEKSFEYIDNQIKCAIELEKKHNVNEYREKALAGSTIAIANATSKPRLQNSLNLNVIFDDTKKSIEGSINDTCDNYFTSYPQSFSISNNRSNKLEIISKEWTDFTETAEEETIRHLKGNFKRWVKDKIRGFSYLSNEFVRLYENLQIAISIRDTEIGIIERSLNSIKMAVKSGDYSILDDAYVANFKDAYNLSGKVGVTQVPTNKKEVEGWFVSRFLKKTFTYNR